MENILIDSDVILDFFLEREPFEKYATAVLNKCEAKEIKGFVTPLIIANVYYLLRKYAKHDVVIDKLSQLLTFIDILVMDKKVVVNALNSNFKDFEDALQNFSAVQHSKVSIVLTRNVKDYSKSSLVILTPETFIKGN